MRRIPPLVFWMSGSLLIHLLGAALFLLGLPFFQSTEGPLPSPGGGVEIVGLSQQPAVTEGGRQRPPASLFQPQHGAGQRPGEGVGPGVGPGSGTESGTDAILTEIRRRIERAKRYPLLAKRQGVAGTALVEFGIGAQGQLIQGRLLRSSGSPLLDEAALQTLARAAPFPLYPSRLSVAIRFELAE